MRHRLSAAVLASLTTWAGLALLAAPGAASVPLVPAVYNTIVACRVFDSRGGAPVVGGVPTTIQVGGSCGVPIEALSVAFNLTVISPSGQGHLVLYRGGTAAPATSTINFGTDQTTSSRAGSPPRGTRE